MSACAFLDEFANHGDKLGMITYRASTDHVQAQRFADLSGFDIQIVEHFHVIGNKADRHNHNVIDS